ncbi:MAG: EamA family transporter [Acidobacteriia bacterium]|nr:EamA family transporter [Terriglobia bacterium]
MTAEQRQHRFRVAFAFALVYVFWGSTYLAIRISVESFPPYMMGTLRFTAAGLIMLTVCALQGKKVAIGARDFVKLSVIGILLLSIANVLLGWAELYVPTGLAALIVAVVPLWFLVIDTWVMKGDHLSRRGLVGIALGIAGLVVLLWPKLVAARAGLGKMQLLAGLTLVCTSGVWALGSTLSRRWTVGVGVYAATGWEMLIAGVVNFLGALALGDVPKSHWTASGLGAIVYLVIFGSLVGYTAYIWLLDHVPTGKVATYAYVNPVVAVFLGWLILHEKIDVFIVAGSVVIIAAVALVTSAKVRPRAGAPEREPELPACEAGAD